MAYAPCDDCRAELVRIYNDHKRVRIASIAHMRDDEFMPWLKAPNEALNGDTPWGWIDAGFTQPIIDLIKTMKRTGVTET